MTDEQIEEIACRVARGDYATRFTSINAGGPITRTIFDPQGLLDFARAILAAQKTEPVTVTAKPLVWTNEDNLWHDECGFYIELTDDDPALPWIAGWGEGDTETFRTLEEAKAWCQEEMNAWARERCNVTPQSAEATE